MSDKAFVVCNRLGQFWARAGEWVDGREPQRILKLRHRDEAVNQLVELSAKDIDLRGAVRECELGRRGEALVTPSEHLTPTQAERASLTERNGAEDPAPAIVDAAAPGEPAADPAV